MEIFFSVKPCLMSIYTCCILFKGQILIFANNTFLSVFGFRFKSCKDVQVGIHVVLLLSLEKWVIASIIEGNLACRPYYLVIYCVIKIGLLDIGIPKFSFDFCNCRIGSAGWREVVCHPVSLNEKLFFSTSRKILRVSSTADLSIITRMKITGHMQVRLLLKTWSRLFPLST